MNAARHARPIRPKLSAEGQTEMILHEMLLAHLFPDHVQVEEFRRNIEYAKVKLPALHAHAEILFQQRIAEDGRLGVHPEECRRCSGAGVLQHQGRLRFCGCPAGEIASRTQILPDPAPGRLAAVPKPLSAKQQLQQLRSLFEGGTEK